MAKAAKKEKEVSLETVLWNCRVALHGVGSTEKNRDAVIGLVFLKFAGDKFEKRRAELIETYGNIPTFLEKASFYNAVNVFYLKETARWSYIVKNASADDIAVIQETWRLCKMNLAIRGIAHNLGLTNASTFTNDLHKDRKGDYVMANPPFNYHPWGQEKLTQDVRWKYGIPPAGNANYAWIQHMIHHLAPGGKIGLVLVNSALSVQSGGEGEIRKKIIEDDLIEGIIAMPT